MTGFTDSLSLVVGGGGCQQFNTHCVLLGSGRMITVGALNADSRQLNSWVNNSHRTGIDLLRKGAAREGVCTA